MISDTGYPQKRIQIFKDDRWIDIEFKDLKKGDHFRSFEPDGKPIKGVYTIVEGPFFNDGVWGARVNPSNVKGGDGHD